MEPTVAALLLIILVLLLIIAALIGNYSILQDKYNAVLRGQKECMKELLEARQKHMEDQDMALRTIEKIKTGHRASIETQRGIIKQLMDKLGK